MGGRLEQGWPEKGGSLEAEADRRGPAAPGLCPIPPFPHHCSLPVHPDALRHRSRKSPTAAAGKGRSQCSRVPSSPSPATAVAQPCLLPSLLSSSPLLWFTLKSAFSFFVFPQTSVEGLSLLACQSFFSVQRVRDRKPLSEFPSAAAPACLRPTLG